MNRLICNTTQSLFWPCARLFSACKNPSLIHPLRSTIGSHFEGATMRIITTTDGTEIYYKDWAHGQPVVFHQGWPFSGDDNRPGATIS